MAGTVAKTAVNIINKCFIIIFFYYPNAKIMQMSGMRACYQIPECSLSYTKIMQGERNSKTEKRSFFRLDIAEPKLILYKDNAR